MYTLEQVKTEATDWFKINLMLEKSPETREHLVVVVKSNSETLLVDWQRVKTAKSAFPELTDFLIDYVSKRKEKFLNNKFSRETAKNTFPTGLVKLELADSVSERKVDCSSRLGVFQANQSNPVIAEQKADATGSIFSRYTEAELTAAAKKSSDNRAKLYLNRHLRPSTSVRDLDQMVHNLIADGYLTSRESGYVPERPKTLSRETLFAMTETDLIERMEAGCLDWDTLDAAQKFVW